MRKYKRIRQLTLWRSKDREWEMSKWRHIQFNTTAQQHSTTNKQNIYLYSILRKEFEKRQQTSFLFFNLKHICTGAVAACECDLFFRLFICCLPLLRRIQQTANHTEIKLVRSSDPYRTKQTNLYTHTHSFTRRS